MLYPVKVHTDRTSSYDQHVGKQKFDDIECPVKLHSIDKFEKLNDISANAYGCDNGMYPLRVSGFRRDQMVDLLLIDDSDMQVMAGKDRKAMAQYVDPGCK